MTSPARSRPIPLPTAGLSDEARKAITQSFEALQDWRRDVAGSTERYQNDVFDKMGAAAKAMGWPDNLIEASKAQMKQVSQIQLTMIDQIMEAWQHQVKSPGSLPSMPAASGMVAGMPDMTQLPGMGALGSLPLAPVQFWMQAADMWQKSWQQAMSQWIEMQQSMSGGSDRRR